VTLDLAAAKALCDRATPGPWKAANGKGAASVTSNEARCAIYINVRTCEVDECVARWQADARFIAAARTLVPELIHRVEKLQAEVAMLSDAERANRLLHESHLYAEAAQRENEKLRDEIARMRPIVKAARELCAQPMLTAGAGATWGDVARTQAEGPRLLGALMSAVDAYRSKEQS
jgi:hypothetical protein